MKKLLLTLFFTSTLCALAFAQQGEISGKVIDDNGDGVPFANVAIVEDGVPTGQGATTDFDGNYAVKPLSPGSYDVKISYLGYQTQLRQGVVVTANNTTFLDVTLTTQSELIDEVVVIEYKVPLIDPGATSTQQTITAEEISSLPTKNISSLASTTAGVYQGDEGDGINIKGGRTDANEIYVDGIKIRGSSAIPASAIEQLQVTTGGIDAKYGDATGGITNVSLKTPKKLAGGVELVTSQYLDPYGYNLAALNLSTPILQNKETKKTTIGLFVAGQYEHVKDNDPSAVGVWQVKEDKYQEFVDEPLIANPNGEGFFLATETLTFEDMENVKAKPNVKEDHLGLVGKFDIKPADNMTLTLGGTFNYDRYYDWVERYTLFNSENNPLYKEYTYRGFVRFTHNIGQKVYTEEDAEQASSAFQNAYYTVQFDYQKFTQNYQDDTHGDNLFQYGHIGNFETMDAPVYTYGDHDITDDNGNVVQTLTGYRLIGYQDTAVVFTPNTVNPLATRYTDYYYELVGGAGADGFTENLSQIQQLGGLINGQRAGLTHDIWYNIGRQYNGYSLQDDDQFSMKVTGAFDILKPGAPTRNKHSIEFGVEFEQRVDRTWQINPLQLWDIMRLSSNLHITQLDVETNNPTLIIDGVEYEYNDPNRPVFGANDTIIYDRLNQSDLQTNFDKNMREALGLDVNGTDIIYIDEYDPSFFSLEMLSADELLNNGSPIVNYYGYDIYGNKLSSQPSYNDFFTKKDENGELIRSIPAFRPIYTAGYIQDKFQFKDLTFNVGIRVDRFDANQKVLKDQYSLYEVRTVSEVSDFTHPGNAGQDWFVYVDDADNASQVLGYRDGDTWYDANGNELSSGAGVAGGTVTGDVQPYLVDPTQDIKDADNYDPNGTFKDYEPQISIMPRLQFSFNLTDKALFFAHYDILTQRPQDRLISTPDSWLFFQDNIGTFYNNPALKPEKTIDFQLGFRQKVSNTSAITISAFYREFKDMVQVTRVYYAYPRDYNTFGNEDFGTAKGFTLDYDLRRTGNIRLKANYSLQFAEGTGSSTTSQLNLIQANQPNLKTISPLNFDARHTLNLTLDYRYGSGTDYNGPMIGDNQILSNFGVNLTMTARSGTPYTQQRNATPEALFSVASRPITEGSLNGSRLPWTFRVNTKINKAFDVTVGGKKEGSQERTLGFNVYLQIQNLLNADNVASVFRYTGVADDDGYLASPEGIQDVNAELNSASYVDLYGAYINRPDNYSRPRTIRLGVEMNF